MNPVRKVSPPVFYEIMHPVGWRLFEVGGEEGIRTLGSDESPVFKTGSLNHSDTSPSTRLLYPFSPSLSTPFVRIFSTRFDGICKLFRPFLPLTISRFTHCKFSISPFLVEKTVEKVEEWHYFGLFYWEKVEFPSPICGKQNLFFDRLLKRLYATFNRVYDAMLKNARCVPRSRARFPNRRSRRCCDNRTSSKND